MNEAMVREDLECSKDIGECSASQIKGFKGSRGEEILPEQALASR